MGRKYIPVKVYKNHVDVCEICYIITIAEDEKENHKRDAHKARQAMKRDAHKARQAMKRDAHKARQAMKSNKNSFSFDLQKAHTILVLYTSTAYYKHQLTLYNKGIHDRANNQGYSHLWCENAGLSEIASILYAFVKNHCKNLNKLTFWCDNYGGQNKNQYLAQALIYIVNTTNIEKVDLKFPYKGHTFLADDSNFGNIEKKIWQKEILYTIEDYKKAIESAHSYRENGTSQRKKIIARLMKRTDFKDFNINNFLLNEKKC